MRRAGSRRCGRYGGIDAAAAGIVDEAVPEADVLPQALERARILAGKDASTLGTIKARLYADVVATLRDRGANAVAAPAYASLTAGRRAGPRRPGRSGVNRRRDGPA